MAKRNKNYIGVILTNFFKFVLRIVLFPFTLWFLIKKANEKRQNRDKIAVFNISQIDCLNGVEFENFLCEFFERLGYQVKTTKASHDYGADLILSKQGKISVVQAKCYAGSVGIKAIQEIVSAKVHYGASDALAVTNNYFSKDAEVLALEHGVKLIDRSVLEQMLKKYDFNITKQVGGYRATDAKERAAFEGRYKSMI